MKKTLIKALSIILTLVLILAIASPALANCNRCCTVCLGTGGKRRCDVSRNVSKDLYRCDRSRIEGNDRVAVYVQLLGKCV